MTPTQIVAGVVGAAALIGLGVVVGDLLVDDPAPGDAPSRAAVEVAGGDGPDAHDPALSIVSIGGDGTDVAVSAAANLGQDAIDVDAFEAFDTAAETGGELPDLADGPLVEELDDEAYTPLPGDEGTVDDPTAGPGDSSEGGEGDDSTPGEDSTSPDRPDDADGSGSDVAPPIVRPDGVPALDPALYDLEPPVVVGFDDPCALGSPVGCPFGIPAVVLGADPVVPLRLGSVGVLGTEAFHRDVCASTWSELGEGTDRVGLAVTTNQEVELQLAFDGSSADLVAQAEPTDVALAEYAADLRADRRIPSEGPGSVVTCAVVPAASVDSGLVRGKATATVDDQRDTLGFGLRIAGPGRSRPIAFRRGGGFPTPAGSTAFELTVPQRDPSQQLAVVGFVPLDGPRVGPTKCAAFEPMLEEVRGTGFSGRQPDDGAAALPVGLSLAADDGTRVSPRGTLPVSAAVPDGYNATFRGYLPSGSRFRLCAWWFELEEDGDGHRIADGAPSDTATMEVRSGVDIAPGVYVTAITTPEPRPAGFYNLYLVKPGVAAICLPRHRPAPFPVGPVGPAADSPFAADDDGTETAAPGTSSGSDDGTETAAPGTGDGADEEAIASDLIPAGRHDFGPRQAQEAVRICVPRARAPVAVPMVKAGSRPYVPGSAPIPIGGDLPLVPDGLEPPPIGKTFPVVARDGAVLELTIVNQVTARQARGWQVGAEVPQPPATVRSSVDLVGEPVFDAGEQPGSAVLSVRFTENVDVRARLTSPASDDDPSDVCTTGASSTEATSPNGADHRLEFRGLCAGVAYGVSIEATDADGTTATFDGGWYRVPPNAGFFDIDVEVTSTPDGGAQLGVADVQFLRQPGVVSLSARSRADDLLGDCLAAGDADTDGALLTSFGEQARIRVRVEGAAGCEGGPALRLDSTLELSAADLAAGPVVFDVTHPAGLTLRVTITPRAVT